MNDLFIKAFDLINPDQLILIGLILYFFYNRLDNKLEKIDKKFDDKLEKMQENSKQDFKEINQRFDNLYNLVINLLRKDAA